MNRDSPRTWVFTDLETTDIMETSAIISLGMVVVDFSREYSFQELIESGMHYKFDYKTQIQKQGRTWRKSTIDWWKMQGESAKDILRVDKDSWPLDKLPNIITGYLKNCRNDKDLVVDSDTFWVSGGQFDYSILRHVYMNHFGYHENELPWHFWNLRDRRTALHFGIGEERGKLNLGDEYLPGFVEHNALHDACADVIRFQEMFEMMGIASYQ